MSSSAAGMVTATQIYAKRTSHELERLGRSVRETRPLHLLDFDLARYRATNPEDL